MSNSIVNSEQFKTAAETIKNLNRNASDEELLDLYSWYKQATVGDINIKEPSFIYFTENKKWQSWKSKEGNDTYKAEVAYITCVNKLIKKYGLQKKN